MESNNKLPINTDTVLILERALESQAHGQKAIENLNIIEQVLVEIVNYINLNCDFKSEFIVRRLPTYMVPFVNKNEYAIILENFDFNLSTPKPSISDSITSIDGSPVKVNFNGAVEVDGPICSQEIFKRFAAAFIKGFTHLNEHENHEHNIDVDAQIIGPHLIQQLKLHPEIPKIFKFTQPNVFLSTNKISRIKIHIDEIKTSLKIELDGTGVRVFPSLFTPNGYSKIVSNLIERLPLYHPSILTIGESLTKGFLLFPTNFESLWTIQCWPSESHIISKFHPNSIVGRVLKLYGSVCINPIYFWETLNASFLIGIQSKTYSDNNLFLIDFLISSFLNELEKLPNIRDWEPELFSTRLTNILAASVSAYDKGFHLHYFTKINVLRGIWKRSFEVTSQDEDDDIEVVEACQRSVSPDKEHNDRDRNYTMEDDFELHFEDLGLDDDDDEIETGTPKRKFTFDSVGTTDSREERKSGRSKSISKFIGRKIMRRFSNVEDERPKSALADVASGFEGAISMERKRGIIDPSNDDVFASTTSRQTLAETSFSNQSSQEVSTYENRGFIPGRDTIYFLIMQLLDEIAPANYLSDTDLITYLDNCRKVLNSQNELINSWNTMLNTEIPKPKNICPHSFTPRQLEYISLIMKTLSKCLASNHNFQIESSGMPPWEISGDILRIVLCQLRVDTTSTVRQRKSKLKVSKSFTLGSRISKLSFRSGSRSGSYDVCKSHSTEIDSADQLPLESPEKSTTQRLLQWLWQLRNSEIGKLSNKAKNYIEALYSVSMTNSHFLEQFNEERGFETTAIRSAVAVSRILADPKFPPHVPLLTASQRGWLWAEMILSLVSWNKEKGLVLKAKVPKFLEDCSSEVRTNCNYNVREINVVGKSSLKTKGQDLNANFPRPDPEAITLAFHSELATPLGWNDLEDPRRPGPYTVPILIFTNQYFNSFEMSIGNIVQVMMRIQKFSLLQHVATMLNPPHRKTALNEIRKLSKSTSFRTPQFDENVMSKTFKRLASLRNTGRAYFRHSRSQETHTFSCGQVGCNDEVADEITRVHYYRGKNIECTRL